MSKYLGVINNLLSGSYISPFSKKSVSLPIDEIVIERSIENIKFKFTKNLLNKKNLVISGENSFKAFGEKVLKSLKEKNQPMRIKTGGSTFKNPINQTDKKVWELIRESVSIDTKFGDAQISEKHSNFFVNKNKASFDEMNSLINFVKKNVKDKTGININLEIKIIE